MFDRLDINFKYQVLMQEMSAVGVKRKQQAVQWTACPLNGFAKDGKPRSCKRSGIAKRCKPPSSLQGCIDSVFRNKHLILEAFCVVLTLILPCQIKCRMIFAVLF